MNKTGVLMLVLTIGSAGGGSPGQEQARCISIASGQLGVEWSPRADGKCHAEDAPAIRAPDVSHALPVEEKNDA